MKITSGFIYYAFASLVLIPVSACNTQKTQNPTAKTKTDKTWYFPEKNIYFDESTGSYHYSLDSGKTWQAFVPSGNENSEMMRGEKIEISDMDAEEPWLQNNTHIAAYHGKLYSILSPDTGMNKAELATRAKAMEVGAANKTISEPEEEIKTGLLKRLFGKKKKKN